MIEFLVEIPPQQLSYCFFLCCYINVKTAISDEFKNNILKMHRFPKLRQQQECTQKTILSVSHVRGFLRAKFMS